MRSDVSEAVDRAVSRSLYWAVNPAAYREVYWAVYWAADEAVYRDFLQLSEICDA